MMSTTTTTTEGIYFGSRGKDFQELIAGILKKSKVCSKYVKILTGPESMKVYASAFTSELVDPDNNYQVLEQVGDLTGNKFIVNYMYERFPQLDCVEGVKVVARLRINYGAKQSFSDIARKLGFWDFISATNDLRQRRMKPLLEDVFEAFLGATERIIDRKKRVGVGYAIVYDILASIFDEMEISLRYEDLYDSKTRLKELFDMYESSLGPLVYNEKRQELLTVSTVYRVSGGHYEVRPNGSLNKKRIIGGSYVKIGEGVAALTSAAQQKAAAVALETLNNEGWAKPVPRVYKLFDTGEDKKKEIVTVKSVKEKWGSDMDILQDTKEKTKYQSKYQSTPLAMYCQQRNIMGVKACITLKSNPNIADTEGMYATDLLFIGEVDEGIVEEILKTLVLTGQVKISDAVFKMYYTQYVGEYFGTVVGNFLIV